MQYWSLDMARQTGWDLWVLVCCSATAVLAAYAVVGRGRVVRAAAVVAVLGTLAIVAVRPLHDARVGLAWTFAVLSLLSAAFYLNLRPQLGTVRIGVLLVLRVVALAVLVPMLFEPVVRHVERPTPERPLLFLIDTSGSMSIPDAANGPTRIRSVWQAIRPELPTIDAHFVPKFFTFDTGFRVLDRPEQLATVAADGKGTDVVNGVAQALTHAARDDAAVVLVSDGIDNASPDPVAAVRGAAHPVHTVRVGSELATPAAVVNVAVADVAAPDDFAVHHASTVTATVQSSGLADRVVEVKLAEVDPAGRPVGEVTSKRVVLQPSAEGQAVRLSYTPATAGLHDVAVWIDPVPGERSTADNRQMFQALALDPRIRVLYVEGSVRLEYKWTRLAFLSDANVELATYLRKTATSVEAGGTVDGQPFRGLPTTADGWAKFDVVLIGDVEAAQFSPQQLRQIEQRTAAGGGLLMLGGRASFAPGGYGETPIEQALPVFVGDKTDFQDKERFVPQLTAAGLGSPILDGLGGWFALGDKPAAKQLPPLNGNLIVGRPKSGAEVLMVHANAPGGDQVVLATQRYGRGRSAAFTVDTTYLWFLPLRGLGQDSPYNKLWGQMVRWLAGQDVRDRGRGAGLTALLNKSVVPLGESVRLRALVRDERGDATKYAQVNVTVTDDASHTADTYALSPAPNQPGMYQAVLSDPGKGGHAAEVVAVKDGKELGRQTLHFDVLPPADEMTRVAANPKLLAAIADQTHGYHCDLGQLPQLIDQLIRADPANGRLQEKVVPLDDFARLAAVAAGCDPRWASRYDLPIQATLAVSLLVGEWFLRRRWQLT